MSAKVIRRAKGIYLRARERIDDLIQGDADGTVDLGEGSLAEDLWRRHRQRAEQALAVIRARGGLSAIDAFIREIEEAQSYGGPDLIQGSLAVRAEQAYQRFAAAMRRATAAMRRAVEASRPTHNEHGSELPF